MILWTFNEAEFISERFPRCVACFLFLSSIDVWKKKKSNLKQFYIRQQQN